jgi:hypothetical protein
MTIDNVLARLQMIRSRGSGKWSAKCPSHSDQSPSLSIAERDGRILLHCFAGCRASEIVKALGLRLRDLFTDLALPPVTPPSMTPRVDLNDLAFQFELAALDRELRTDNVLKGSLGIAVNGLDRDDLDRFMAIVARAYQDWDRAQFLQAIADDLRWKSHEVEMKKGPSDAA